MVSQAVASIVGAAIGGGSALAAGGIQAHEAGKAADAQSKAAADTLAYEKEQAAQAATTAETNRRANYDQWAAEQRRLSSVGGLLGDAPREIPGYVPLPGQVSTPTPNVTAPPAPPLGSVGSYLAPPPATTTPAGTATTAPGSIAALMGQAPAAAQSAAPVGPHTAYDTAYATAHPLSIDDLLNRAA